MTSDAPADRLMNAASGLKPGLARAAMQARMKTRAPKPAVPRLFTAVAVAATCLLGLKATDVLLDAPLVETASAQSLLGPEPPQIRVERAPSAETDVYVETAGREAPGRTPADPFDVTPTDEIITGRIAERRRLIAEREREIEMRENLLKAAEARIEERIGSLKAMSAPGAAGGADADAPAPDAGMDRIVTMYEAMKAKEAARILSELDMNVLEDLARRMNPRKLADIMGEMEAEPATRLTVRLAGAGAKSAPETAAADLPRIMGERPAR